MRLWKSLLLEQPSRVARRKRRGMRWHLGSASREACGGGATVSMGQGSARGACSAAGRQTGEWEEEEETSAREGDVPGSAGIGEGDGVVGGGEVKKREEKEKEVEKDEEEKEEEMDEEEDDEEEDNEGEDDEEEDDEEEDATLIVDFDAFSPAECDFHGIRALLASFLDDEPWDVSSLVDSILKVASGPSGVGSVLRTGEEGYVMALISCLPLPFKAKGWAGEVHRFLQSRCENAAEWECVWEVLSSQRTGLLLCERVLNLPPQLIPHLYSCLFQELEAKAKAEQTGKVYDAVVVLSRVYKEGTSGRRKHKQAMNNRHESENPLVFLKTEDELLYKMSSFKFTFPLHSPVHSFEQPKGSVLVGLFMLIPLENNIPTFLSHLEQLCSVSGPCDSCILAE